MTLPATSALCGIFTLYFAGSPLIYSPAPRGTCTNCCQIREARDIRFLLYTRNNPKKPTQLYPNLKILNKSNFNKSELLIIYMHGFSESAPGGDGQSGQEIRDAFLNAGNYNVILVDWSALTAMPWYTSAVQNMPKVSRYIARFLRFLNQSIGYEIEKIHVIGFSLGAEIAGFAGQQLQEWGILLPRITGLDPAYPLFDDSSSNRRLRPTDARFVDVIHTDGGILGNPHAMGHADFYPNGGIPLQPGCARQEIANNRWIGIIIGCSHQRAWQYFIESLKWPKTFHSNRCESTENFKDSCRTDVKAYMGIQADKRLRGKYYLETNEESPFGKNYRAIT